MAGGGEPQTSLIIFSSKYVTKSSECRRLRRTESDGGFVACAADTWCTVALVGNFHVQTRSFHLRLMTCFEHLLQTYFDLPIFLMTNRLTQSFDLVERNTALHLMENQGERIGFFKVCSLYIAVKATLRASSVRFLVFFD